jgi:sentrin-specific protease 1
VASYDQKLRDYVEAEHLDKKRQPIDLNGWEDYHNPRTPQQANHYDCGVFTSQFIECLSRRDGHFDFDQTNMPYLRQKMIHEIKMMQLTPEKWFDPNE